MVMDKTRRPQHQLGHLVRPGRQCLDHDRLPEHRPRRQTANLLASGQVLIAGGVNFVTHKFTELENAELYTR